MNQLEATEAAAVKAVAAAGDSDALKAVETQYLGKNGAIGSLMRSIGALAAEDRPSFGAAINASRARVEYVIAERRRALRGRELESRLAAEKIDPTLPGLAPRSGLEHVLSQTTNRIKHVLGSMGFVYEESPELEHFRYNFDALNYPPDHPAMDAQDTFYIASDMLLRTQCTALQGHIFENLEPPFRIFTVGRCFRNEAVDRTHSHTFHQVDAFVVDEGISMAHLKGTLGTFAQAMFGGEAQVRFRPDFFPFVEPGVDYAISTPKLFDGRWLELGGAGLIHPTILERHSIDTERFTGFAFGLGVERIPMIRHGIDDLRYFFDNDMRFLSQFA